jgi:5-formyltetrahydrofolate cyclo-ligase
VGEAPDSAASAKRVLRTRLLAARSALSADQLEAARAAVCGHVLVQMDAATAVGRPWYIVCGYQPLPTEPGSVALLEAMAERGAAVLVPLMRPDRDLDWTRWPAGAPLGIDEVARATVLLVPALAVDWSGRRLGRGGGSYDRVLARVSAAVPVAALLHRGEILDEVPADPWDRTVNAVVTPDGWLDIPAPLNTADSG